MSINSKYNLNTPKYIIADYFDTKLSMFGLAPSAIKEGAEGPRNGLKGQRGPRAMKAQRAVGLLALHRS